MSTIENAVGKWRGILKGLGVHEDFLRNKHGPCPICGGKNRFRFDDREARGTYFCNSCGAGDGFGLAMAFTGLDFKTLAKKVDRMIGTITQDGTSDKPQRDPRDFLRKISGEIIKIGGNDPVMNYLTRRGVGISPAIRLHPRMRYFDDGKMTGIFPAMVVPVLNSAGIAITFHVTYLTPDGQKAAVECSKKLMPATEKLPGAAIRLCAPVDGHIALAEGIETALAVTEKFGEPCWSCVNANMMEAFRVPEGITSVRIFGDNDASFTGQKAAYVLANRLKKEGINVSVVIPDKTDSDFADEI